MAKLLVIGDVHYSPKRPIGRTDDYGEAILLKLLEVFVKAEALKVDAIVCTGDLFHSPTIPLDSFFTVYRAFRICTVPFYIVPGNHDIYGYNAETLYRTSLYLLSLCLENVKIIGKDDIIDLDNILLTGEPYSAELDVDCYGYDRTVPKTEEDLHVHVVHGMLMKYAPNFDKFTLIDDIKTKVNADVIVTGHYHPGFGEIECKRTTFINNGAICRREATDREMNRQIGFTLIENDGESFSTKFVLLESAVEGSKVLSNEHLAKKKEVKAYVDEFHDVLKSTKANKRFTNIQDMIKFMAEINKVEPEITNVAIDRVSLKLEQLGNTLGGKK